jgi:nitrite reductase/ring-hydroxylating ferredoxin subunit
MNGAWSTHAAKIVKENQDGIETVGGSQTRPRCWCVHRGNRDNAHAAGQLVVLVRVGDHLLAVDGTCTHHGAPLAC